MPTASRSRLLPLPVLLLVLAGAAAIVGEQDEQQPITHPGCPDNCGNMSIPFPFGLMPGCFREGFQVTCDHSFDPPRAFLAGSGMTTATNTITLTESDSSALLDTPYLGLGYSYPKTSSWLVELMDVSVDRSEARAYGPITSRCSTNVTHFKLKEEAMSLAGPHHAHARGGSCAGRGCCEAALGSEPSYSTVAGAVPGVSAENNTLWRTSRCSYAMVIEKSRYTFSTPDLYGDKVLPKKFPRGAPVVLDFAIVGDAACPVKGQRPPPDYACVSNNSHCVNATVGQSRYALSYVCKCSEHYQGNPYIANGCRDIDECKFPDIYFCSSKGICMNRLDGYDCPCKPGMKGDGKSGHCAETFPLVAKAIVGTIGCIFVIVVMSFLLLLSKEKKKTNEFYEKNGGSTLEKAKIIKLFKKGELMPYLKDTNFIGNGGFGAVYKGILGDELVAIKKTISGSLLENEQFANEVIIQSQVIHKNIVRLIGCCLEVDTPLLVYEFLSNGSLHDILHGNDNKPLNLDTRLRIAAESADGLAYMHSKTNTKILHGDVKPANILLDDRFVAKIADFGISRLIARDKQHTAKVIGDMSYMDPVYLQSGLLTEKSDVYSFGVVLLELISRKKAMHSDNNSLVNSFIGAHRRGERATELFDKEIAVGEDLDILQSLAGMAIECLSLEVDQRPDMTDIAHRLLIQNNSRNA
ncbi:Wall-associated receptor kinase 1 [Triticum urartu]|uniref:Wall-associated receptor kinase 1 n=1 Tax=Triticum urartu TaxID=4572 RepID=M8AEY8_TRIUA|nr:Wall-associated receptor kinase 1 [Triticum urartu]